MFGYELSGCGFESCCSYLFLVHSFVASKIEMKEKKVATRAKPMIDGEIEFLSLDDVRNCKETTFVEKRNPQFGI